MNMTRRAQNQLTRRIVLLLAIITGLLILPIAKPALAHNLDTRSTGISFADDFIQTMSQRASLGQPLVRLGDEFWVILKTTPGPGTTTGVGGYQTFYVPAGVQVTDAAYVQPDATDPRGYRNMPMKGQSPIAIGDGPIGAKSTPELIGFTLPGVNGLGFTSAPVSATGLHRGTIAGVYADTGIFFSTDAHTAFNSYGATDTPGGSPPMINNSGDTVGEWDAANVADPSVLGVMTLWDSYQLRAFGRKDVAPIIDYVDGRGNAPWGMASAVAGPQSGYAWGFDYNTYSTAPGSTAAKIQAAIGIGPWQRIKYPGSQISSDTPGLISSLLGYAGVDASWLGTASTSLPPNVTAVRFAIGQLELGRPEFSAVKLKITSMAAGECYKMYADAFGGDAGGTDNGKDHLWRYFDPTVVALNPCIFLQKVASKPIVAPGETFSYTITFANNGAVSLPNIILSDTLPSGLTFVSANPPPSTASAPTYTWNLGTVNQGDYFTITLWVKATGTGTLFNTVTAKSGTETVATANESVEVGIESLLEKSKSVTPTAVAPGSTVTYTITVDNIGTGTSGTPVVVHEFLPAGFSYTGLVSAKLNGADLSSSTITTTVPSPDQPQFSVSQGIQPGKQLVIVFTALVGADVKPGTYYNSFEVQYEGKRLGPVPEAPVTVAGGQIGDTIYRDWNGNGTQDAGEEGLPGVTVQLWKYNSVTLTYDLVSTDTTDANGNYLFTGLVAGQYQVRVASGVPAGYVLTGDPQPPLDGIDTIVLGTDEVNLTADFGYQPKNSGSIGDTVFEDVGKDGAFTVGTDTGIPGVTVKLYEDTNGDGVITPGTDALVATTITDITGHYTFSNLPEGFDYLTYVDPTDANLAAYFNAKYGPPTPVPYQSSTPDPEVITNLTGAYTAADFGFWKTEPGSIGDQVFIDNNRDGTFDTGDGALAGITVNLYRDGVLIATTVSGPDGSYLFPNLGPGNYSVAVDTTDPNIPAGYVATTSQYTKTLAAGENYLSADFPFVVDLSGGALFKTVNPTSAGAGDTLTFSLKPYYPGNDLLADVRIFDRIPAGATYLNPSVSDSGSYGAYTPIPAVPGNDPGPPVLDTAISTSASLITPGNTITVTLNVKSSAAVSNVSPFDLIVTGGSYSILTGPLPTVANVPAGGSGVNFVWTVKLSDAAEYYSAPARPITPELLSGRKRPLPVSSRQTGRALTLFHGTSAVTPRRCQECILSPAPQPASSPSVVTARVTTGGTICLVTCGASCPSHQRTYRLAVR